MEVIKTPAGSYTPAEDAPIRDVNVDFASRAMPDLIRLTQYDTKPIIAVHLYYSGAQYTVPAGAAVNIRMRKHDRQPVYNPALGVSEDRHTAYIQVTDQMSLVAGEAKAVIEVIDNGAMGTALWGMDVELNPVQQGDIISQAEYKVLVESVAEAEASAKRAEAAAGEAAGHDTSAGEHATQAADSASAAAGSAGEAAGSAGAANADRLAAESARLAADAAALLAKSWARGETGSRDGEDQDNSMYYAAQAIAAALQAAKSADDAQRVAQGAVGYYKTPELLRAAHETATDGNWAIVGSTDTIWVWDSDTSDWTDSGNKTDLSQYYTQAEIDEIIAGITPQSIGALPLTGGTLTGMLTMQGDVLLKNNYRIYAENGEGVNQAVLYVDTYGRVCIGHTNNGSLYFFSDDIYFAHIPHGIGPATFSVTLPARGWVDGVQTVTDARFIDGDNIDYDIYVKGMYVPRDGITITAGQMTVRVDIVPTEDVTIDIRRKEVVAI